MRYHEGFKPDELIREYNAIQDKSEDLTADDKKELQRLRHEYRKLTWAKAGQ